MAAARQVVHERFGVVLEPEVQVLGEVEWPADWQLDGVSPSRRLRDRWRRRVAGRRRRAIALVAGYFLWFRDSSLVAVDEVEVEGATTQPGARSTAALTQAADEHDHPARRRRGAGAMRSRAFPRSPRSGPTPALPDKLTITSPSGCRSPRLKVGRRAGRRCRRTGYVLPGIDAGGHGAASLDEDAAARPASLDAEGAAQAAILGAAPEELRERIEAAELGRGARRRGRRARGSARAPLRRRLATPRTSGEAVAAVLADPESRASPAYVDVSVPERAVTGG